MDSTSYGGDSKDRKDSTSYKRLTALLFISQSSHKVILVHGCQHLHLISVGGQVKVGGRFLPLMQAPVDCCSVIRLGGELLTEKKAKVDLQAGTVIKRQEKFMLFSDHDRSLLRRQFGTICMVSDVMCGTGRVTKSAGRTAHRLL